MKRIKVALNDEGIDKAISELQQYYQSFVQKAETFRNRLASEIQAEAQQGFNNSVVNDLVNGGSEAAHVQVSVNPGTGNVTTVVAVGEDAVWVEFGAGVYHNGAAGSSPHPNGLQQGMTIGSYGKGMGKRQVWGYYQDGDLVLTHGTPAQMPMYYAVQSVAGKVDEIARGVFG